MRVGIVGHEAAKFTPETEVLARLLIRSLLPGAACVISGGCHLGGIDIWAVEEAKKAGIPTIEHIPTRLHWSGSGGFKERNQKIAESSDVVYSIVVTSLPPTYKGMRFPFCYHCGTDDHVKSGGCWTAKEARRLGKVGQILLVNSREFWEESTRP